MTDEEYSKAISQLKDRNGNPRDMSVQWVDTYREGSMTIMESNMPNDTIGDQAFEYDYDGVERKKWQEYLEELDRKGTRGDLVYHKMSMMYNPALELPVHSVRCIR